MQCFIVTPPDAPEIFVFSISYQALWWNLVDNLCNYFSYLNCNRFISTVAGASTKTAKLCTMRGISAIPQLSALITACNSIGYPQSLVIGNYQFLSPIVDHVCAAVAIVTAH